MEYVSTGIEGLDYLLGGGLPRNTVTVVSGPVGSGKSTFALQFLADGIKRHEEVALFISLEEGRRAMLHKGLSWLGVSELEEENRLVFIEYPIEELEEMIVSPKDPIKTMIDTMDITRIAIEPAEVISLMHDKPIERRRILLRLVNKIRKWGVTAVVVAEDSAFKQYEVPRTRSGIESVADGFVHLSYELERNVRKRYIEVLKMRGAKLDNKRHEFVLKDKGILIKGVKVPKSFKERLERERKVRKRKPKKEKAEPVADEEETLLKEEIKRFLERMEKEKASTEGTATEGTGGEEEPSEEGGMEFTFKYP